MRRLLSSMRVAKATWRKIRSLLSKRLGTTSSAKRLRSLCPFRVLPTEALAGAAGRGKTAVQSGPRYTARTGIGREVLAWYSANARDGSRLPSEQCVALVVLEGELRWPRSVRRGTRLRDSLRCCDTRRGDWPLQCSTRREESGRRPTGTRPGSWTAGRTSVLWSSAGLVSTLQTVHAYRPMSRQGVGGDVGVKNLTARRLGSRAPRHLP
jgi:hypothetical protein